MDLGMLAVLVFATATWVCWRAFGLRVTHAVCAGLTGFFLAGSVLAPAIRAGVRAVFAWVATWHL